MHSLCWRRLSFPAERATASACTPSAGQRGFTVADGKEVCMDRVRDWFGVRTTLLLPTLVAILSFVTGVANISAPVDSRPLDPYLPGPSPRPSPQTVGFTGTLTGFLLLVSTYGLRRRLQVAWYATPAVPPDVGGSGVLQGSVNVPGVGSVPVEVPLVALSLFSIPTVLLNRRLFDRELQSCRRPSRRPSRRSSGRRCTSRPARTPSATTSATSRR